jgi:hypothetical protein
MSPSDIFSNSHFPQKLCPRVSSSVKSFPSADWIYFLLYVPMKCVCFPLIIIPSTFFLVIRSFELCFFTGSHLIQNAPGSSTSQSLAHIRCSQNVPYAILSLLGILFPPGCFPKVLWALGSSTSVRPGVGLSSHWQHGLLWNNPIEENWIQWGVANPRCRSK